MRQLIFTSTLSGVDRGRSGFCTVARSASLRERTVAELEKMSVYEPPLGRRPTVFLYRVYSGIVERLYILTRACDAGTDVFGRPNYVVHHLIFRRHEISKLLPPAELALRYRNWCSNYTDEPRFFDDDDALPEEFLRPEGTRILPATRWADLTGDAGNAALLCPQGEARATVFIGDSEETETVLGLFAESSEILGGENAWDVAFSTGICAQHGAGRFLWRMISASELEARRPGDFVLDFLAPLTLLHPPKSIFADYARTGKRILGASTPIAKRDALPANEEPVHAASPGRGEASPEPVRRTVAPMRFADIAGTAKFMGISLGVFLVVLLLIFFLTPHKIEGGKIVRVTRAEFLKETRAIQFEELLSARIESKDYVGASNVWCEFVSACPQEASAVAVTYLPKFKLHALNAFTDRIASHLEIAELAGELSSVERALLEADLACYHRACSVLKISPTRGQKRNQKILDRALALLQGVPAPEE